MLLLLLWLWLLLLLWLWLWLWLWLLLLLWLWLWLWLWLLLLLLWLWLWLLLLLLWLWLWLLLLLLRGTPLPVRFPRCLGQQSGMILSWNLSLVLTWMFLVRDQVAELLYFFLDHFSTSLVWCRFDPFWRLSCFNVSYMFSWLGSSEDVWKIQKNNETTERTQQFKERRDNRKTCRNVKGSSGGNLRRLSPRKIQQALSNCWVRA